MQRQGHEYVGLLELLDPLGTVSAKSESSRWRLHYNNILGDFFVGKSHALIQGRDIDLSGKFLLENGRGLVPLASLSSLLPAFWEDLRRCTKSQDVFSLAAIATHFTATVSPDDASRLVFRFTAPVNPSVATEPGKLRMTFSREPVTAPASPTLTFGSKTIPSATYSEGNGVSGDHCDHDGTAAGQLQPGWPNHHPRSREVSNRGSATGSNRQAGTNGARGTPRTGNALRKTARPSSRRQ